MLVVFAFVGYVGGFLLPVLLIISMIGCAKKTEAPPNVAPSNKDVQLTPSQQANLEAEMAAALEAEKKAKEETTKVAGAAGGAGDKAPSDAAADPNPPVSLQKPMSLGVTKAVDVKSPGVGVGAATPTKVPSSPAGAPTKAPSSPAATPAKGAVSPAATPAKAATSPAGKAADNKGKLPPGKPPKVPPNMPPPDDGQSKFVAATPANLAVSHYIKPTPGKK